MDIIPEIFQALLEYGILGLVIAFLTWALIKKDRQVENLYKRFLTDKQTDATKYRELADGLQKAMNELMNFIRLRDK